MKKIPRNRGFMQIVFLAVVIIAALAYFKIDLHAVVQMPIVHQIITIMVGAWTNYIFPLLSYLKDSLVNMAGTVGSMATSTATTTAQVLGK